MTFKYNNSDDKPKTYTRFQFALFMIALMAICTGIVELLKLAEKLLP